jgi:hypothetical protein
VRAAITAATLGFNATPPAQIPQRRRNKFFDHCRKEGTSLPPLFTAAGKAAASTPILVSTCPRFLSPSTHSLTLFSTCVSAAAAAASTPLRPVHSLSLVISPPSLPPSPFGARTCEVNSQMAALGKLGPRFGSRLSSKKKRTFS